MELSWRGGTRLASTCSTRRRSSKRAGGGKTEVDPWREPRDYGGDWAGTFVSEGGSVLDDAGDGGGEAVGFKRLLAPAFVEDETERKNVGAVVVGTRRRTRGHVGGSASGGVMVLMLLVGSSGLLFQARRATPKTRIFHPIPAVSMMFSA